MSERATTSGFRSGMNGPRSPDMRGAARPQRRTSAPDRPRLSEARARAARRHSLFVAVMKGLLPTLVVGLIAVLVVFSQDGFAPDLPEDIDFDPGDVTVAGSGVKMLSPKLSGLDDKDQRFEVTAASAIQDRANPALVTLEQIRAEMRLVEGGWVRVDAKGGVFNSDESLLALEDEIEVTMSSGYVARLSGADVDFHKGTLVTPNPVLVFMNAGVITGNAMEILERGKLVRFTNRASMTINGTPTELGGR